MRGYVRDGVRIFGRLKRQKRVSFGVLDIETWGLDARSESFAFGVVYEGEGFYKVFYDIIEMRNYLLDKKHAGKVWFAHNGGGYDYLALFRNLFEFFGSENVVYSDSQFIQARYLVGEKIKKRKLKSGEVKEYKEKQYIYFWDSANILKSSVKKLGESLGIQKLARSDKFDKGVRGEITEEDVQYCVRDCEIVFMMLEKMQALTGCLRPTIASISMKAFRLGFMQKDYYVNELLDFEFRNSYYGGRVEVYDFNEYDNVYCYDINSLYPYVMLKYPIPDFEHLRRKDFNDVSNKLSLFKTLLYNYEGMAKVKVVIPKMEISPLPYRHKNKLLFGYSEEGVWGYWNFNELRMALKYGCQIVDVEYCVYAKGIKGFFENYVKNLYALRKEAKKEGREADSVIYKFLLNSLYGKFAEYHDTKEFYTKCFNPNDYNKYMKEYGKVEFKPIKPDIEDGYYIVDNQDKFMSYTVFSIASYITSWARVVNFEMQMSIRKSGIKVLYTDTDSFYCDKEVNISGMVGEELGQLKLEGCGKFKAYGNKMYIFNGKTKLKGASELVSIESDKIIGKTLTVIKLKQAIRQRKEIGKGEVIFKEYSLDYDKREVKNGYTETVNLDLLLYREEIKQELKAKRKEELALLDVDIDRYKSRAGWVKALKRHLEDKGIDAYWDEELTDSENDLRQRIKWEMTYDLEKDRW